MLSVDIFLIFTSTLFSIAFLCAIVIIALVAMTQGHWNVARQVVEILDKLASKTTSTGEHKREHQ